VPYVFVPSKEALGTAGQTKRPTSCVLIKPSKDEDTKEKYEEAFKKVKSIQVY
jgi:H/ACA ribonucleoprotein complex subunit 2